MNVHKRLPIAIFAIALLFVSVASAGQWPRFRGPNGQGISDAKTIPVKWSLSDYDWRVELPGSGPASPVVWDNKVFTTCADASVPKGILVAVDAGAGQILWKKEYALTPSKMNRLNSYATGTPALASDHVYVLFSTAAEMIIAALDHNGGEVWQRDFGPTTSRHGPGVSPIVVDDLVVFSREQRVESDLVLSEWIALDRRTGQTRWTTPRKAGAVSCRLRVYRPRGQFACYCGRSHRRDLWPGWRRQTPRCDQTAHIAGRPANRSI
jgi:outer membrane protein assembly factor BamB